MEGLLRSVDDAMSRTPRVALWITCLLWIVAVGTVDSSLDAEISLSLFYLIPVVIASWYLSRNAGLVMAAAASMVWILTDVLSGQLGDLDHLRVWDAVAIRLVLFSGVTLLLSWLRNQWLRERREMLDRLLEADARAQNESRLRLSTMEQLRHADRLSTVGTLAAGLAHELGTPLNVVLGRAKMIAAGEVTGDEAKGNARTVAEQAERMARIIRQLLDFARRRAPHGTVTDVRQTAEQTLALLTPMAKKASVALVRKGTDEPAKAKVDADQLQQVLTNLVVNGIHSMPRGGTLSVVVDRVRHLPPDYVSGHGEEWIRVAVRDEGTGIPPEALPHIFDPFFTTKGVGEGTGLGLSVAFGIVREHGGWIGVESEPGKGSCFRVYLPVEK
jgi:signal transduction histidine kinase